MPDAVGPAREAGETVPDAVGPTREAGETVPDAVGPTREAGETAPGPEDVPEGLHEERTRLAWQRTAVAGTALGVGAVCVAVRRHDGYALWGVAVLIVACAAAAVLAGEQRGERPPEGAAFVANRPEDRLPSPWRRLVATACVPVLLACAGILLALSDPSPVVERPRTHPGAGGDASSR